MAGTLFLVATPIGNLEDITLRALRVLREVAVIAAEDTRRTAILLAHFDIRTPVVSLHGHNERERAPALVDRLRGGESVALVSDAGSPLLADPGALLVRLARQAGCRVEAVPGPSAVVAALTASGLPATTFTFLGFVPARGKARARWLRAALAEPHTVVCFEAPHRLARTLADLARLAGDRPMAIARELTKLHEEIITGTAAALAARVRDVRGECTLVIAPASHDETASADVSDEEVAAAFDALTASAGLDRREAIRTLARRFGRPAREVYAAIERHRREPE